MSNIYLHKLDEYVERELIPQYTRGAHRKLNPEYGRLRSRQARARKSGKRETVRNLTKEMRAIPHGDMADPGFRRLKYLRYNLTGLSPGHSYEYQVIARWGNTKSDPSATVTVSTIAPPLNGNEPVNLNTVSTPGGGASLKVGDHWSDNWLIGPHCTASGCTMTAHADLAAPGFAIRAFTIGLHGSGAKYSGSTQAQISSCSTVKDTNTVTLTVTPKGAVSNGAWSTWRGTMTVSAPYTTVGDEFRPGQSWTFAVSGTNG